MKVPQVSPNGAFPTDWKYAPLEYIRGLFVGFYQQLFHHSPSGAYHWNADDEISEILITDEEPVKAETIGARPCISTSRSAVSFYSLGLDDMLEYDPKTGQKKKSVLVPGTLILNCSSRVRLESERIAWICAEQLWLHRELLMKAGFFEIGRQPNISAPTPAGSVIQNDSGDEWFTTAVTFPFQFYRTSQVTPLGAQIVQEVQASMRTRLRHTNDQYLRIGGHGGAANGPGVEVPVSVQAYAPPPFAPDASDVYGGTPRPGSAPAPLPTQPHPLNPALRVVVRTVRANSPGLRPPGMGGRAIPMQSAGVEESSSSPTDDQGELRTVKV